jgi:hypothetical protein
VLIFVYYESPSVKGINLLSPSFRRSGTSTARDVDGVVSDKANYFLMEEAAIAGFVNAVPDLYNGNISRMVTALGKLNTTTIGKAYEYDQLNRISKSHTYTNYSTSLNKWLTGSSTTDYYSAYNYDANGNILNFQRNAQSGTAMDRLKYNYIAGTNQLHYVDDSASASTFDYDIDDQATGNYTYDKIGNLTSDVAEEIETIEWTVYGKIKSITRTSSSTKPNLAFEYSPDGHRVAKHVTNSQNQTTSTWYMRDASGNILATCTRTWEMAINYANVAPLLVYKIIDSTQGFSSALGFLNSQIQWGNKVSTSYIASVKTELSNQTSKTNC